jgi:hypothetical protein
MDIGKAFTFVFEDDDWIVKILIAAAILFGGIILGFLVIPAILAGIVLSGYGAEITRRVLRGDAQVLPQWDNWGQIFADGLKIAIIGIVYALPIILFSLCLGVPAGIMAEDSESASAILSALSSCLNLLWSIPMGLLLPAAIARFIDKDDLAAAFHFGEILSLVRDNFVTYLLILIMGWVTSFIGGIGFAFCLLPGLVTAPYAGWVTSHLYGQAYLEATGAAAPADFDDLDLEEIA